MFRILDYVKPIEVVVDRIYDNIIVVEVKKGEVKTFKNYNFKSIKEGDVIEFDKSGNFYVNKKKTNERKKKIKKLVDKVFVD